MNRSDRRDLLSAGKESSLLWHPRSIFQLCTNAPCESGDAENDDADNCGIRLPILGLTIPTSCWRPDMFWITRICQCLFEKEKDKMACVRDLPSTRVRDSSTFGSRSLDGMVRLWYGIRGHGNVALLQKSRRDRRCEGQGSYLEEGIDHLALPL